MSPKDQKKLYIFLFCLAFILKLIVFIQFNRSIFANLLVLDMKDYAGRALSISGGNIIGSEPFSKMPFYPYFLAFCIALFGKGYAIIRFIQIILGSLSCVFAYIISSRMFNERVGIIAFFMMLLFRELYSYEMLIMPTTLGVFFYLAIAVVMFSIFERYSLARIAFLALLVGCSCLNRAYMLYLVPAILLILGFSAGITLTKRIKGIFLFSVISLLVISSAPLHNYLASGEFIPFTTHGGMNLYVANNPGFKLTAVLN
jgi:4-amino-4-deoxy-L-arabinose transferase-like glycosyltransferase